MAQLLGDLWPSLQYRQQIRLGKSINDDRGKGCDRYGAGRSREQSYFAEMISRAKSQQFNFFVVFLPSDTENAGANEK